MIRFPGVLWIALAVLVRHGQATGSKVYLEGGTSCKWDNQRVECGGANTGMTGLFSSSNSPCFFVCDIQDGAAKYLSLSATKETGMSPLDGSDEMDFYLDSGQMCENTEVLEVDKFGPGAKVGSLSSDQKSLVEQNIRITDTVC